MAALALTVALIGSLQAVERSAAVTPKQGPASSAVLVPPIDHSVVQSIDATSEPDSSGAAIAAYGP
jgi:hypothetical protein